MRPLVLPSTLIVTLVSAVVGCASRAPNEGDLGSTSTSTSTIIGAGGGHEGGGAANGGAGGTGVPVVVLEERKAFPTAEGFGQGASGGREGRVVLVTNLDDSGPGSLDAALRETGPRTVVFRVGGVIRHTGGDYLSIPAGSGDVTIAGETAPGDGILVRGAELRISASNVVVRNLRVRQDPSSSTGSNVDGLKVRSYDSSPLSDVIIDHCSVSWGIDENVSVSHAVNVTVQHTLMAENTKNFLIQRSKDVSVLNNVTCLTNERNIRANTIAHLDLTFEMVNNLVYGFNWATIPSEGLKVTVENNIFKVSDDFEPSAGYAIGLAAPNPANGEANTIENTYIYAAGNVTSPGLVTHSSKAALYAESTPLYRSAYVPRETEGLESRLLAGVGAYSSRRDAVDVRCVQHIQGGTGAIVDEGVFPTIEGGEPYDDDDGNGIDDAFEVEHGISSANEVLTSWDFGGYVVENRAGYTALEMFLFWKAGDFERLMLDES